MVLQSGNPSTILSLALFIFFNISRQTNKIGDRFSQDGSVRENENQSKSDENALHCYHPETEGYHQLLTTNLLVTPQACQLANDVLMTIGSKSFLSDGLATNSSLLLDIGLPQ